MPEKKISKCPHCDKEVQWKPTRYKGRIYHRECAEELKYRIKSNKKVGGMYKGLSSGARHI